MKQIPISESFQWAQQLWPVLKQQFSNDGVSYYECVANHADIKNRNGRVYTNEELRMAASSLSERPLNINHDDGKMLSFPENQVLVARYENGTVECIIQVADPEVNQMIQNGQIGAVSIEGMYLDGSKNTESTEYPTSLHFQALALLTNDDLPSDPQARILRESVVRVGENELWIPGHISESVVVPKNSGEPNMSSQVTQLQDAEWTTKMINDLPDSCFAYIAPGGGKDSEGKTVPRTLRNLPYKGPDGKPDPAHVRNALARLSQTDIPDAAKKEANDKLQAAAKELGIQTAQMQAANESNGLSLKIDVDTTEANKKIDLLERRIANLQAELQKAGVKDDAIDDVPADHDAVVDPTRNEDGTFASGQSLQTNKGTPAASDATPKQTNPAQSTQTNVDVGRNIPDEGTAPKQMQSLQNVNAASVKANVSSVGVGNPESTDKPKMGGPVEANPLAMTNQPNVQTGADEKIAVTKASSLMGALTNASTNVSVKVIPTGVSESKMPVTNNQETKSEKSMSQQETTQKVNESAANSIPTTSISVKLEGATEIKQAAEILAGAVKESATPKPQAKVSGQEATQTVVESFVVKEATRFKRIADYLRSGKVQEDISASGASGALGQVWSPDMIVLPPDLPANLRRFLQVKEIPKGQKQVNFTTITTPAFASLTDDTAPSDASQTISEISVTPAETGAKQRVSYQVMESATPDVVQAVERSFQAAALIDEDNVVLTALDGATPAATLYGDESVSAENSITSSMTFKGARLASAMREIQKKGYSLNPGDLIAVLHPVQYDALLKDTAISQYLYFGSAGPIQQGVVPQVYGVDVVRSTKIPTGSGAGSPPATTYHAQVFLKATAKADPNGLGVGGTASLGISRDLMIETWRKIDERALYIVASHRVACGVLQPNSLVHVYTA